MILRKIFIYKYIYFALKIRPIEEQNNKTENISLKSVHLPI